MYQHFGNRLKRDLQELVDRRLETGALASGSAQRVRPPLCSDPFPVGSPIPSSTSVVRRRGQCYFAQTPAVRCYLCLKFCEADCTFPRSSYAVWFGGSMLASLVGTLSVPYIMLCVTFLHQPEFYSSCHTKAQYDEIGPSICRRYQIFGSATS